MWPCTPSSLSKGSRSFSSYIVSLARTPIGSFNGSLAHLTGPELGGIAGKACIERSGISSEDVSSVIMGNVCSANVGQAPASQVSIKSGCSWSTPAVTVNKVCASGMKSVMMASQEISTGMHDCVLAGGFESMSNIPYYLPKARNGYRYGHGQITDGLLSDGLWDSFDQKHMGSFAEKCASDYNFSREEQDAYAISSYQRAIEATEKGFFSDELVPVEVKSKGGVSVVDTDEELQKVNYEKIPGLKSAFMENGTVTAANASSLNDGAAAVLVVSEAFLRFHNIEPLARIISFADAAKKSDEFTTAPVLAVEKALSQVDLLPTNVDFWEINEAFSVVALANQKLLNINSDRLNVNGGAVALGHPIGASGARIIISLISVLRRKNGTMGVATICNGGGGSSAIVLERLK